MDKKDKFLEDKEKQLINEQRAVTDKYIALEQAKIHLGIK